MAKQGQTTKADLPEFNLDASAILRWLTASFMPENYKRTDRFACTSGSSSSSSSTQFFPVWVQTWVPQRAFRYPRHCARRLAGGGRHGCRGAG